MGVPHIARSTVAAALSCVMLSGCGWPGHSRHPKSAPVKPVVAGPSVPPRQARVAQVILDRPLEIIPLDERFDRKDSATHAA